MSCEGIRNLLPGHVAIIMDGNGRWASKRGLPRAEGHRAGARAVRNVIAHCRKLNIPWLTLYAFSSENWNRPKWEIAALFNLLLEFLGSETPELANNGIRLQVLGDLDALPLPQKQALKLAMAKTAQGADMRLNLAFNYGGRSEIIRAAKEWAKTCANPDSLDEEQFRNFLYTGGDPDPDLLIRTSGEMRLSNFLLYQCAYSELYFTPTLWPDFTPEELDAAFAVYAQRQRRFGKTAEQLENNGDSNHGG